LDAKHLFPDSVTYVGIRRDAYLRKFAYEFIQLLAPHFDRKAVTDALK
jgi:LysR family cys regulon transcriptional activator